MGSTLHYIAQYLRWISFIYFSQHNSQSYLCVTVCFDSFTFHEFVAMLRCAFFVPCDLLPTRKEIRREKRLKIVVCFCVSGQPLISLLQPQFMTFFILLRQQIEII